MGGSGTQAGNNQPLVLPGESADHEMNPVLFSDIGDYETQPSIKCLHLDFYNGK